MTKTVMHIAEASGGVERYLVTLLTKMKDYSDFEHILVCSTTFDVKKFKGLVKSVVVIETMHNPISLLDIKAVVQVRIAIKHYCPDIVYCHSSKAGAIGRIANIGIDNKILYNAHGWAFNIRDTSKKKIIIYEFVERMLALITDKIICISEYERKSAIVHKVCKHNKLVLINNGIDFDEYKNLKSKSRKELGIPENAFVVGTIGRLTLQKSPDIFVKMAKLVKEKIPEAYFIIVGDDIGNGEYRTITEDQINRFGLKGCFIITGWVDDPLDYVRVFDVATLLSRWEGFGLVLPEYMLMRKPIVATKVDAIPYVVGDAGILVGIDDYNKAARCVVQLNKNAELSNRIVKNSENRVKLFDAQRTADEHIKLFEIILK